MSPEEILNEMGNPKIEITKEQMGLVALRSLQMAFVNRQYLATILENQIEIKELLSGKVSSDIDDDEIIKKRNAIEDDIAEIGTEDYMEVLQKIITRDS